MCAERRSATRNLSFIGVVGANPITLGLASRLARRIAGPFFCALHYSSARHIGPSPLLVPESGTPTRLHAEPAAGCAAVAHE
jgi:hypothetical protein